MVPPSDLGAFPRQLNPVINRLVMFCALAAFFGIVGPAPTPTGRGRVGAITALETGQIWEPFARRSDFGFTTLETVREKQAEEARQEATKAVQELMFAQKLHIPARTARPLQAKSAEEWQLLGMARHLAVPIRRKAKTFELPMQKRVTIKRASFPSLGHATAAILTPPPPKKKVRAAQVAAPTPMVVGYTQRALKPAPVNTRPVVD